MSDRMQLAAEFQMKLADIGVKLDVRGDRIVASNADRLKPWMMQRLKMYKPELIALRAEYELELLAGMDGARKCATR